VFKPRGIFLKNLNENKIVHVFKSKNIYHAGEIDQQVNMGLFKRLYSFFVLPVPLDQQIRGNWDKIINILLKNCQCEFLTDMRML
jgi:hypothetical protein